MSFELNIEETVQKLMQFRNEADIRITKNETDIKTLDNRVCAHDEDIKLIKEQIAHSDNNIKSLLSISTHHSESLVMYGIAKSVKDEISRIESKPIQPTAEIVKEIVEVTKVNKGEGIEIVVVEQEKVHILTKAEFIKDKMIDNDYIVPNGKTTEDRFLHRIVNPVLSHLLDIKSVKEEYMEEISLEKQSDKFYEKASKKLMQTLSNIKPSFVTYIDRKYEEYRNLAEQELSREASNIIDDSKE